MKKPPRAHQTQVYELIPLEIFKRLRNQYPRLRRLKRNDG